MLGRVSAAPTSLLAPASGYDPASGVAPPRLRRGTVRRDRLVRLLIQSADVPLVLVRAPAGYGKTTLLCQWSERDGRPFVWADPELAADRSVQGHAASVFRALGAPGKVLHLALLPVQVTQGAHPDECSQLASRKDSTPRRSSSRRSAQGG